MRYHFLFTIGQVIFFTIFIFSCTPHFYQPKPLEPVLLTENNQAIINTIADVNMTSISVAYSPKNNLGVQLGIGSLHNKTSTTNNAGRETIYLNEYYMNPYVSAGYYKHLSPDVVFEAYGGIGIYKYKNTAVSYLKSMKNINLFIQPSIAFVNKNFDAAFTVRVDYLNRNKTIITDSVLSTDDRIKYQFLDYKKYFFFQPGITLRAGFKYVKFQFQVSQSMPFRNSYKSIYGYGSRLGLIPIRDDNRLVCGFGITAEIKDLLKK